MSVPTSSSSTASASAAPGLSLKQRIHSLKVPLSPRGLRIARVVYFTAPVVIGLFVMQAAMGYEQQHRVRHLADIFDTRSSPRPPTHLTSAAAVLRP